MARALRLSETPDPAVLGGTPLEKNGRSRAEKRRDDQLAENLSKPSASGDRGGQWMSSFDIF